MLNMDIGRVDKGSVAMGGAIEIDALLDQLQVWIGTMGYAEKEKYKNITELLYRYLYERLNELQKGLSSDHKKKS